MDCKKCGEELKKDSKFCASCGEKVEKVEDVSQEKDRVDLISHLRNKKVLLGLALAIGLSGTIYGVLGRSQKKEGLKPSSSPNIQEEAKVEDNRDEIEELEVYKGSSGKLDRSFDWTSQDKAININKYGHVSSSRVGLSGEVVGRTEGGEKRVKLTFLEEDQSYNKVLKLIREGKLDDEYKISSYKVGQRQKLKDDKKAIEMFSEANKNIGKYKIGQMRFKNGETDNIMDIEIYREMDTGYTRKIVAIEYLEDRLFITDYYYKDGNVGFVFEREENYYRPIPAQQDFPGDRYYIYKDSLVKYRNINRLEDGSFEKVDFSYDNENIDWAVYHYDNIETQSVNIESQSTKPSQDIDLSREREELYQGKEKDIINKAYSIYDLVNSSHRYSLINGNVFDDSENIMEGGIVKLYIKNVAEPIMETKTDSQGNYTFKVSNYRKNYYITIEKHGYIPIKIYDVDNDSSTVNLLQETVYMIEDKGEINPVEIVLLDATNGKNFNFFGDIKLIFRKGLNNRTGEIAYEEVVAGNPQYYNVSLADGVYTLEIVGSNIEQSYKTIYSSDNFLENTASIMPKIEGDEIKIVLSWGSEPEDLDSHLFTSTGEHICYYQDTIENGYLDVDDRDGYGPETITLDQIEKGKYRYYVVDFLNAADGDLNSYDMSNSNGKVYVYSKDGLISSFNVPRNRPGIIWDVFEIINGRIIPIQRYYNNIEDYQWWSPSSY